MTIQAGAERPWPPVADPIVNAPDRYLTLRQLATYSGTSQRWLRYRLGDAQNPLPHYRLPSGKLLIQRAAFDAWMQRYRRVPRPEPAA
jgi:hypothetical protein